MRLAVDKQRHILRQVTQTNLSNRNIAKLCGVSPNTVCELKRRFNYTKKSWDELASLTDDEFRSELGTEYRSTISGKAIPDWTKVHEELQYRDMTLSLLHAEYLEQLINQPQLALCYSQFTANYREWQKTLHISMRQFHPPGEKMFIDFCGRTMPVVNQETGEVIMMQIFVAVLGASGYTFAYAVPSQKISDWLECHSHAFAFFEGTPKQLVPDNLKSAVTKHTRELLILNRCYMELADHYQCVINPARPGKPKDKGLVEVNVQIIQRWVLASLRHRKFFSQEELNLAITEKIKILNYKTSKKYTISRFERYEKFDKPALTSLPDEPYKHSRWKYSLRVPMDYHIEFEGSHYSVPYQFIQHNVDIRTTKNTLEVLLQGQRIASHVLRDTPGKSTLEEHMPIAHQQQAKNEPEQLLFWASAKGKNIEEWIRQNITKRRDFVNGLKSARKLRHWLKEGHNLEDVELACEFALHFNQLSFAQLKSIFERRAYLKPKPEITALVQSHENIRGPEYYRSALEERPSC